MMLYQERHRKGDIHGDIHGVGCWEDAAMSRGAW